MVFFIVAGSGLEKDCLSLQKAETGAVSHTSYKSTEV